MFNCFILFFLCSISTYTEENRSLFVWSSVFSILTTGVIFHTYIDFNSLINSDRVFLSVGRTIDPNALSTNFCIAFAGIFEIYNTNQSKLVKLYLLLSTFILSVIVFLLASRGAILGLIAICVVNFILRNKTNLKCLFLSLLASFLIITTLLSVISSTDLFPSRKLERYELQKILESKGSGRIPIWKNTLNNYFYNLSIKEVVFGTGFGTFMDVSPIRRESHNIYLNTLIESGFLGFLLFILFIFYCLKNAYLTKDYFAFSALIGLCICGLSLEMGTLRVFWITLWLCNLRKTDIVIPNH